MCKVRNFGWNKVWVDMRRGVSGVIRQLSGKCVGISSCFCFRKSLFSNQLFVYEILRLYKKGTENSYGAETTYCGVNWDLLWNFPVDITDVNEQSRCKFGFHDGSRIGRIIFVVKIAASLKITWEKIKNFRK